MKMDYRTKRGDAAQIQRSNQLTGTELLWDMYLVSAQFTRLTIAEITAIAKKLRAIDDARKADAIRVRMTREFYHARELTEKAAALVMPLLKAKKVTPKGIRAMLEGIIRVREEIQPNSTGLQPAPRGRARRQ